jgi:hypothetical protein
MESFPVNNMHEWLGLMKESMESEIRFKQDLIVRQQREIDHLRKQEEEYKGLMKEQELKLQASMAMNEGNKQLLNKLLNDISRLHTDVEWYKRTYEQRSFLGTIKEKLKRKI